MDFVELIEDDEEFELTLGASTFFLRRLTKDKLQELQKKHTTRRPEFIAGAKPIYVKETDDDAVNAAILNYCVVNWDKVPRARRKGEPKNAAREFLDCTDENKQRLPGKVKILIMNACSDYGTGAGAGGAEPEEEEQKNS